VKTWQQKSAVNSLLGKKEIERIYERLNEKADTDMLVKLEESLSQKISGDIQSLMNGDIQSLMKNIALINDVKLPTADEVAKSHDQKFEDIFKLLDSQVHV
jgi:hypothetical protein